MNEKNSVAVDESWRDPINLQAKLLKHQSFEAEILANRNRVQTLIKVRHWALKECLNISSSFCMRVIQEHQQLKRELFPQEGDDMLASSHPAKGKIKPRIKDVDDSWDQLLSNCKEKKLRLLQAYQVLQLKA